MRCFFVILAIFTLSEYSDAAAPLHPSNSSPLSAPKPKSQLDYNYSNGLVGSNASGMSAEEAGDFQEDQLPLQPPNLKSSEILLEVDLKDTEDDLSDYN